MVRQSGGLDPLVSMARNPKTKEDKPLLAAVTGAIWKTAISAENVERFDQLKTVEVSNQNKRIFFHSKQISSFGLIRQALKLFFVYLIFYKT